MIIRSKTAYLCFWVSHNPSTRPFPLMTPSLFINSPTYSAPFDPFSINWNKLNPIHYLKQRICHKSKDGTGPKSTSYFMWLVSPRWMGRTLTTVQSREPAACTACIWRRAHAFWLMRVICLLLWNNISLAFFFSKKNSPFNYVRDLLNLQLWLNSSQASSDNDKLSSFPLLQSYPTIANVGHWSSWWWKRSKGSKYKRWNRVNIHVPVSRTICLSLAKWETVFIIIQGV